MRRPRHPSRNSAPSRILQQPHLHPRRQLEHALAGGAQIRRLDPDHAAVRNRTQPPEARLRREVCHRARASLLAVADHHPLRIPCDELLGIEALVPGDALAGWQVDEPGRARDVVEGGLRTGDMAVIPRDDARARAWPLHFELTLAREEASAHDRGLLDRTDRHTDPLDAREIALEAIQLVEHEHLDLALERRPIFDL